jgi:hypothetical protein
MANEPQPLLIVYVTSAGVVKVKIPYRNLAEERAGRELEQRCAPIISLLSRAARGNQQEIIPLNLSTLAEPLQS